MKGILLIVASLLAIATGQDCPAYYVRSRSGTSCYRYFNIPLAYQWASEFCEMVTPCGNGPAVMGTLAAPKSPQENMEIYQLVASFSQDNQMEREVWLGWRSNEPLQWENGAPAYPYGFSAFDGGSFQGGGSWPIDPRAPFTAQSPFAPVMRREFGTIPGRIGPNRRRLPPMEGPIWYPQELTGHQHAFVCEVPAGQTILGPQQPTNPNFGNRPNRPNNPFGPNQPNRPNNPFGPNQPNRPNNPFGPNQPTTPNNPYGPNQPNQPNRPFAPNQPTGPNQPNQPNRPFAPNQPTRPNQPNQPNQPNRPFAPNQPTRPNQPNQPNRPFGPNQPTRPNQPNQPNQPNRPFAPNQPGTGNRPNQPGTGNRPNQPNQPRLFQ